jgi:ubiquinone/menaquinone biosynthesis C-methylase UbiE
MSKSFDNKSWEENIYKQGRHLNKYPYDLVISIIAREFSDIPKKDRRRITGLDLGCGGGNNTKFFAESGFDVYGIDASGIAIETSKNRFKDWGLKGNFVQGNFLKLPYKDNYFDIVLDRESLYMNNFADVKKSIGEVYNKMKKKGMFISFFYSFFHPDKKFGKMIEPNTYDNFNEKKSAS